MRITLLDRVFVGLHFVCAATFPSRAPQIALHYESWRIRRELNRTLREAGLRPEADAPWWVPAAVLLALAVVLAAEVAFSHLMRWWLG